MHRRYDTIMIDLSDESINLVEQLLRDTYRNDPDHGGVEIENLCNQLRSELQHRAAERALLTVDEVATLCHEHEDLL